MIQIGSLAIALGYLVAARVVARTAQPAAARSRASLAAAAILALAATLLLVDVALVQPRATYRGLEFGLLPLGMRRSMPAVIGAIALLAASLSPLASHPPRTLARMLVLFSLATAFVGVVHPLPLALFWGLSAWVVWLDLRERRDLDEARHVFTVLHGASGILALVGSVLFGLGSPGPGAVCWLLALTVREAMIPVHGWFPALVERAPLGLVVAFSAPQLGVYAHIQLVAQHAEPLALAVAAGGALTAVLAAALGVVQDNARRALAFLVMSQTALVTVGLQTGSAVAGSGALVAWQVLALATTGFTMIFASLEARRGPLSLRTPSGSFAQTPRMAVAFLFLGFASVGLPLTLGFVAEDLLVQGLIGRHPWSAFGLIVATAINGMTVIRCFFALFSGTRVHNGESDLTRREVYVLSLVMSLLVVGGIWPSRILRLRQGTDGTAAIHAAQHP